MPSAITPALGGRPREGEALTHAQYPREGQPGPCGSQNGLAAVCNPSVYSRHGSLLTIPRWKESLNFTPHWKAFPLLLRLEPAHLGSGMSQVEQAGDWSGGDRVITDPSLPQPH